MLAKGVLDPAEAKAYLDLGADGIVVSNHGGRQLDAAPSAVAVLPKIRETVGPEATLIVDGGVRSGLDIARMLALGADFVLMGRPFLFALGAVGQRGGDHVALGVDDRKMGGVRAGRQLVVARQHAAGRGPVRPDRGAQAIGVVLAGQHVVQNNQRNSRLVQPVPPRIHPRQLPQNIH